MLPTLWLLVGSDQGTDRQCQLLSCPGQLKIELLVCIYEISGELVFIYGISGWSSPFGSVHVLQLGTIKQGFLLNISVKILDLTLVLIWPLPESIIFSKNAWWCDSSDLMIYTDKQGQTLLSLIERCWNFDMLTFTDMNVIFPVIEFWVVVSQNMDLFRHWKWGKHY